MSRTPRTFLLLFAAIVISGAMVAMGEKLSNQSPFSQSTFDFGTYTQEIGVTARFYAEAIGLKEVPGFSVEGNFCRDSGLTTGKSLNVRCFVLGDEPTAPKLKLVQSTGENVQKANAEHIPSQYGFQYVTIHVASMKDTLARLEKAGVKPENKCPVKLPKDLSDTLYLTVVHDPDGNLVELVGPM